MSATTTTATTNTPPALRAAQYFAYQYRKTWRGSVTTSFLYPVLYLAAMGLGLGTLINAHSGHIDHVKYLVFLAPGLLASTAMQIGGNEATYPVLNCIKWDKAYVAMLATPLEVGDVLLGHMAWIAMRLLTVCAIYVAIMAAFGTVLSWWALAAVPAAILTGLSFTTPIAAFSATQEKDSVFSTLYRLVLIPLFLFSGTFFPVDQLPGWLQVVAESTPLYHGVSLCRDLTLGQIHLAGDLVHVLYLVALVAVGVVLARRTYRRRLVV
ncbi:MAG: ABC transporter permease [Acidimicrobiales bacterium]